MTTDAETRESLRDIARGYPARYRASAHRVTNGYSEAEARDVSCRRSRLWTLITAEPGLSLAALGRILGVVPSVVRTDLLALEAAGYIRLGPRYASRARVVLIPCITVRRP